MPPMNQRSSSFYRLILTGICWVAVVNFLALWTVSFVFGDAWFGYVEDGRFYLAKGASHRQPLLVTPGDLCLEPVAREEPVRHRSPGDPCCLALAAHAAAARSVTQPTTRRSPRGTAQLANR